MKNSISTLEIKNFKSIKHLKTDCKRVNVFIGKPNVGKSNILEAISILGTHYSTNESLFLSEFVRYEDLTNIFYDEDLQNSIKIIADETIAVVKYISHRNDIEIVIGKEVFIDQIEDSKKDGKDLNKVFSKFSEIMINPHFFGFPGGFQNDFTTPLFDIISVKGERKYKDTIISYPHHSSVKKYTYEGINKIDSKFQRYLLPANGRNLFTIIDHDTELRKEIANLFLEYGLQFVADKKNSKFEIQKNIDGYIIKYPYSSMADTFLRLIFYYATIDSNKDSVLVLEEPEVHSFPPYTADLAQRIIESEENQFFITTHSPYLLQSFISGLDAKQLNVFITYYENYETKIRKLTDEELRTASDFSVDLFYNLDNFVPNA